MGNSQEAGLTTRLLRASVEEAFPTAPSSVDLCLEAISKNELIVGKAGVPERVGEGGRQIRAGKSCREGASHHHLGFKVSVWGHMGVRETWERLENGQGGASLASEHEQAPWGPRMKPPCACVLMGDTGCPGLAVCWRWGRGALRQGRLGCDSETHQDLRDLQDLRRNPGRLNNPPPPATFRTEKERRGSLAHLSQMPEARPPAFP